MDQTLILLYNHVTLLVYCIYINNLPIYNIEYTFEKCNIHVCIYPVYMYMNKLYSVKGNYIKYDITFDTYLVLLVFYLIDTFMKWLVTLVIESLKTYLLI